jgi:hypothetical protein
MGRDLSYHRVSGRGAEDVEPTALHMIKLFMVVSCLDLIAASFLWMSKTLSWIRPMMRQPASPAAR